MSQFSILPARMGISAILEYDFLSENNTLVIGACFTDQEAASKLNQARYLGASRVHITLSPENSDSMITTPGIYDIDQLIDSSGNPI